MEHRETSQRITQLYKAFAKVIFVKIRSIVLDEADAADILQHTFERLYIKAHKEKGSETFRNLFYDNAQIHGYLYRIAINESYRSLQKKQKAPQVAVTEVFEGASPEDLLTTRIVSEQLQTIDAYIQNEADEREQTLFYLLFFEELKQKEIAEILGVTGRYVRTLHKQLVQKLKNRVFAN